MKTILITGATGFLGTYLLEMLLKTKQYELITVSRKKEILEQKFKSPIISHFEIEDIDNNMIPIEKIYMVIHMAFARNINFHDIMDSIEFSKKIFTLPVSNIINVSSKSVYGQNLEIPWKETSKIRPNNLYAIGKHFSELLLDCHFGSLQNTNYTNLRLASLVGNELSDRIINKFIKKAIVGNEIIINGGKQQFDYLDVRDAVDGILALLNVTPALWKPIYNLGFTKSYNIVEIANIVARVAKEYKYPEVKIILNKTDDFHFTELGSTLFYQDTNWRPQYDMEAIVRSIFDYKMDNISRLH